MRLPWPDGNRLLTWGHGDDKGILWDLSTLEQVAIIPWTEGTVFPMLRFSSGADTLIVLADDGRAELLTAPPLQEVDALVDFKKPTE